MTWRSRTFHQTTTSTTQTVGVLSRIASFSPAAPPCFLNQPRVVVAVIIVVVVSAPVHSKFMDLLISQHSDY